MIVSFLKSLILNLVLFYNILFNIAYAEITSFDCSTVSTDEDVFEIQEFDQDYIFLEGNCSELSFVSPAMVSSSIRHYFEPGEIKMGYGTKSAPLPPGATDAIPTVRDITIDAVNGFILPIIPSIEITSASCGEEDGQMYITINSLVDSEDFHLDNACYMSFTLGCDKQGLPTPDNTDHVSGCGLTHRYNCPCRFDKPVCIQPETSGGIVADRLVMLPPVCVECISTADCMIEGKSETYTRVCFGDNTCSGYCGDGFMDDGEECDLGLGNGDSSEFSCSSNCTKQNNPICSENLDEFKEFTQQLDAYVAFFVQCMAENAGDCTTFPPQNLSGLLSLSQGHYTYSPACIGASVNRDNRKLIPGTLSLRIGGQSYNFECSDDVRYFSDPSYRVKR